MTADDNGVIISLKARQSLQVESTLFSTRPLADPRMTVLAEFAWDGGLIKAAALNKHAQSDLNQIVEILSLARTDGGFIAVGSCQQGRVNGQVDCNDYQTPLVVEYLVDAGVHITTDATFGTNANTEAALKNLTRLGDRILAYRTVGVGTWGGSGATLGTLQSSQFSPTTTIFELLSLPGTHNCSVRESNLVCAGAHVSGFQIDDCTLSTVATAEPVVLEFDAELRCRASHQIAGGGWNMTGLSAHSPTGTLLLAGQSGPAQFGNGLSTAQTDLWSSEWGALGVESLTTTGMSGGLFYPQQLEWIGTDVVLQTKVRAGTYIGSAYSGETVVVAIFNGHDLRSPRRRWHFSANGAIESSAIQVVEGTIVLLVSGVDVRMGSKPLSTDGQSHAHLLLLQE